MNTQINIIAWITAQPVQCSKKKPEVSKLFINKMKMLIYIKMIVFSVDFPNSESIAEHLIKIQGVMTVKFIIIEQTEFTQFSSFYLKLADIF